MKKTREVYAGCLDIEESRALKARVYDLSELAAKQVLYGIIQIFTMKGKLALPVFEEVIDDAGKYGKAIQGR
jgi:hypothetical protein